MTIILCDISALQFHRTPPWVIDGTLLPEENGPASNRIFPAASHRNATTASVVLSHHLDNALAGVSPPFHIIDTEGQYVRTDNIKCHRIQAPPKSDLIFIGSGLYVTSPARTLLDLARKYGAVATAKIIYEFCGLYSIGNKTDRLQNALQRIPQPIVSGRRAQLAAYHNHNGAALSFEEPDKPGAFWELCMQRNNEAGNLWKRPPICTMDELLSYADTVKGSLGSKVLRRALRLSAPGSGSPAETIAGLLIGPERRLGQEGLPPFHMNRLMYLDDPARLALGQRACVLDISWPDGSKIRQGCCVEIDGAAFHDDSLIDPAKLRNINKDSARRTALAHMNIEVVSLAWSQLADLGQWDMAIDLVYQKLGMHRPVPSITFLKKRDELHQKALALDIGSISS